MPFQYAIPSSSATCASVSAADDSPEVAVDDALPDALSDVLAALDADVAEAADDEAPEAHPARATMMAIAQHEMMMAGVLFTVHSPFRSCIYALGKTRVRFSRFAEARTVITQVIGQRRQ